MRHRLVIVVYEKVVAGLEVLQTALKSRDDLLKCLFVN